jgi:spore germination cell wall hydrolase CwlJ-like protein
MAFDREIASLTIYCEASSGTPEERRFLAWTLFNRLRAKRFGATIAEVCLHHAQYSEWNDDNADNANLRRGARASAGDVVLHDCMSAFDEVALSKGPDPTKNATHYFDKSIAAPYWAKAPGYETIVTEHFHFWAGVA